jgi:hypothetical protein
MMHWNVATPALAAVGTRGRVWLRRGVMAGVALGLVAGLSACGAPRQPGTYLLDDIDEDKLLPDASWEELKTQLPPVPVAADTLPIEPMSVRQNRTFTFGIDPRSVGVAPGGIVRYTLYTVSDRGAETASYESIRCRSKEWRPVATLRPGTGWERPYKEDWRPIEGDSVQQVLRNGVLCTGGGPAATRPQDLVYRVKNWTRYADAVSPDLFR